jgi:glyoxalase family protein
MKNQPNKPISGIHHITAIASSAADNLKFYEKVLGLRLVKQTVNFDDPYTYHLYYGDAQGNPGTVLTFFPWENPPAGRPGAGMVSAIAFAVPKESIDFWVRRLSSLGISVKKSEHFGETVIRFVDPDGLSLELIGSDPLPSIAGWKDGTVPQKHAIQGFHSATAIINDFERTRSVLVEAMGFKLRASEGHRYRFSMHGDQSPGRFYDVVADPEAKPGRSGSGTVHHIAYRTENDREQIGWQKFLRSNGLPATPVRDRKYFRSIYFHEPGGVLFEIATDAPGFAIDESPDRLGASLKLPDQFEALRKDIERQLPPLRNGDFEHIFVAAEPERDDGKTLVTLHGTGGNEHDLIEVAGKIDPHAADIGFK